MPRLSITRIKRNLLTATWFYRMLQFVGLYALWVVFIRLLTLTLITYFTISPTAHFQDINDAFSSNEVSLMGLSSLLFIILLFKLNPLAPTTRKDIISQDQIEKAFLPQFLRGAGLSGGLVILFVLAGFYRYLGFYIQFDEAPLEIVNVLLRMSALALLAYCEEFIFRQKVTKGLQGYLSNFASANLVALFYIGVKMLQFDIGWMHVVTLYLVSLCLHFRFKMTGSFAKGAGLWAAVLVIFHPLLGLPIFGNHFSGFLLLKYQPILPQIPLESQAAPLYAIRILTGGAAGPLSSLALQLLLLADILRSLLGKKLLPRTLLKGQKFFLRHRFTRWLKLSRFNRAEQKSLREK